MGTMSDVERGRALAELRAAAGLTQLQVGAAFDISKQAVAEWEKGKSAPSRRRLARLDVLYGANGRVLALYDVASDDVTKLRDGLALLGRAVVLLLEEAAADETPGAAELLESIRAELGVESGSQ